MFFYIVSGVIGFVAFLYLTLFLLGELWPGMRYESALPYLLVAGVIGAVAGVYVVRLGRRKK